MHAPDSASADHIRVFLDEQPRTVSRGSRVRDLLELHDCEGLARLDRGGAYVTDGVGRQLDPDGQVFPGAIYRLVRSARRSEGSNA